MLISKVKIQNILSIKEIELGFENNGLILVDGWNHDRNSANGAGKSSIFDSIAFCIYGKLPRKITTSEILRKGTKTGEVTVSLTTHEGEWIVTRARPKSISFTLNGKSQDITQDEFEKRIKLNYMQFMIVMYASQTPVNKFVSLNDSDKKQFLLDLMDLSSFKERKFSIDNTIKELKSKLSQVEQTIGQCTSAINAYKESAQPAQPLMDKQLNIIKSIATINTVIESTTVSKPDISVIIEAKTAINQKLANLKLVDRNRNICVSKTKQYIIQLEELQNTAIELPDVIECPDCNSKFSATDTALTLESLQQEHGAKIDNLKGKISDIEIQADPTDDIEKWEEKIRLLDLRQQTDMTEYSDSLSELSVLKSQLSNKCAELKIVQHSMTVNAQLDSKIDTANGKRQTAITCKVAIEKELQINETISVMLSPVGASAYIMDSILDRFNQSVADHLLKVWPNTTYELQSFKENKSGDIRSKFSDLLTIDGHARSVGSLSGGERAALSLVVDFTITDLMSDIFGIVLNPSILDEPFNGLDTTSRETMVNILEELSKNRAIYIIDHFSESKAMFNKTIEVHKRSGISSLTGML